MIFDNFTDGQIDLKLLILDGKMTDSELAEDVDKIIDSALSVMKKRIVALVSKREKKILKEHGVKNPPRKQKPRHRSSDSSDSE